MMIIQMHDSTDSQFAVYEACHEKIKLCTFVLDQFYSNKQHTILLHALGYSFPVTWANIVHDKQNDFQDRWQFKMRSRCRRWHFKGHLFNITWHFLSKFMFSSPENTQDDIYFSVVSRISSSCVVFIVFVYVCSPFKIINMGDIAIKSVIVSVDWMTYDEVKSAYTHLGRVCIWCDIKFGLEFLDARVVLLYR